MPTGAMGNREILTCLESGQIVIDPFDPEMVQTSSVDVRLGGWFYVAEQIGHRVDFSPYSESEIKKYYQGPLRAESHRQWCEKHQRMPFNGIDSDELIIVLKPGECILAHTVEYIGALWGATTMMKARSSLGRINVSACDDAGWGDIGYINRWTLEVRNKNREAWVPLVVGMPIAQIVFFWVNDSIDNYSTSGHYQNSLHIEELKQQWHPESMLPCLWSDRNQTVRKRLSKSIEEVF